MKKTELQNIINKTILDEELIKISNKVFENQRLTQDDGLYLFEKADLSFLGILANYVREKLHGNKTYFNRNIHIEPTNICIYSCKFCSYSKKYKDKDAWEFKIEDIIEIVEKYKNTGITEIHVVGGVHPNYDLNYYGFILQKIKSIMPNVHIKAFTAVELDYMIHKSNMTLKEGLIALRNFGLDSIPGGGAEIFDSEIRKQLCHEKSSSEMWLNVHETAHSLGIPSNATMLYGHVENYKHRIVHLDKIRELQDKTNGFNTFIPLKFRNKNNKLSHIAEASVIEDLKTYAISRLYLDNISHIKSYWVMMGKDIAQLSLSYGVDDIDGTIDDTTKIYSMAGVTENNATLSTEQLVDLIKKANRQPIERDTLYNTIKEY